MADIQIVLFLQVSVANFYQSVAAVDKHAVRASIYQVEPEYEPQLFRAFDHPARRIQYMT